ncbi:MAG: hypothetical protein AAB965_00860 [Patescibacteria group bacterium]
MAKVVPFGGWPVQLQHILIVAEREFPGIERDHLELHVTRNSVDMCVYEKHEPLTPIEEPTIGLHDGQFIWGKKCRVSLEEAIGVSNRCFPGEDETGGVVLFQDKCGHLVMEPYLD